MGFDGVEIAVLSNFLILSSKQDDSRFFEQNITIVTAVVKICSNFKKLDLVWNQYISFLIGEFH